MDELKTQAWSAFSALTEVVYQAAKLTPDDPILRDIGAKLHFLGMSLREWDRLPQPPKQEP